MKMRWIDAKGMDMALIIRLSWMGLIFYDYQSFQPTITPVYKYAIQCTAISYIASKNAFIPNNYSTMRPNNFEKFRFSEKAIRF